MSRTIPELARSSPNLRTSPCGNSWKRIGRPTSQIGHNIRGHGPFPSYLHRLKFLDSPHCICGMLGDADHYIFSCSLTKEFHLIKPADEHKKAWFNNLLTNRQAVTKMEGAFRTNRNICDTLTQERDHI
ncbi:hypothetical protein AVEN_99068-1 [Araneus ventricosus]|uniref:Reverse transcriptase zinc-binding domain-containing protein n=1 Tax=Araneus ventricosus TaxID=182803 RepID=A0A4Y2FKX6_ARAVE|nr:hypothetical protein AVEN_99068-1 [Araneus ventricosus]